jgi:hypothetical protein
MTAPVRELREELERYVMKIKKTSVFRLELEKDNCPCRISREFADGRYMTPLAEPVFTACEKHGANTEIAEFAKEMMTEALTSEALNAGKQQVYAPRQVEPGDSAGVVAVAESTQAMGVTNLPKRSPDTVRTGPRKSPLSITQVSVDRTDQRLPQRTAASTSSLAAADAEAGDGITITGDIETVPEDPNLTGAMAEGLGEIEDAFDEDDMKDAGVPRSVLNQARD